MDAQELKEICLKHVKWINGEDGAERADLSGVSLSGANLSRANLSGANLSGVSLSGANLYGANLYSAKNAEQAWAQTYIVPEGSIIGWKKARIKTGGFCIVKLRIPEDAKRSNAIGRKCRAEFADVLEVIGADVGVSDRDNNFEYRAGSRVVSDSFDENRWVECSHGIHFFITRTEAENYDL